MKIRLLSDIHLEFAPIDLAPAGEDIIIFAGDIGIHTTGIEVAKRVARNFNTPLLYVAGNHEFYRTPAMSLVEHTWEGTPGDLSLVADRTEMVEPGMVTYLEDRCVIYNGVRFIGATLWTDMEYFGKNPLVEYAVKRDLNDYRLIYSEYNHPLQIEQVIDRHKTSLDFIRTKLLESFDGPTVVITHHTPSTLSVPNEYRDNQITAAYTSRLEDFILNMKPNLWVHGHTHNCFDYQIGDTRVVCNPRGYAPYEDTGFNPNLIIEVGDSNGT